MALLRSQEDLFAYPFRPGHRHVDTSRRAAEEIADAAATIAGKVLRAVQEAGPHGITTDELAALLAIDRGSLQPRTSELRAKRLIGDSGHRRLNANGKKAIVWVSAAVLRQIDAAPQRECRHG